MPQEDGALGKVILAYSGSFRSFLCAHWLRQNRNLRVIACAANLGQATRMDDVGKQALEAGAETCHVADLRDRFLGDYCFGALRAHAEHYTGCFLSAALSRPLIVEELVRLASELGAEYVAHASTPLGNDQVRFELSTACIAPRLKVIAPTREWNLSSAEAVEQYARRHRLRLPEAGDRELNRDRNAWGASIVFADDDLWKPVPDEAYCLTRSAQDAPDRLTNLEIGFEKGVPVRLNGCEMRARDMVASLNNIGGENAIGRAEFVGDRMLSGQVREVHEAPAAILLYEAHRALESLTVDSETRRYKRMLSEKLADIIFSGLWFTDLRRALSAFFEATQDRVTGDVRLEVYKGSVRITGCRSVHQVPDGAEAPETAAEAVKGYLSVSGAMQRLSALRKGRSASGRLTFGRRRPTTES